MKRILSLVLVACLLMSLAACGKKQEPPKDTDSSVETTVPNDETHATEPEETKPEQEIVTVKTVGEILDRAYKNLYESEYVTMKTGDSEYDVTVVFHNKTGELASIIKSETDNYVETEEFYIVKNGNKYETYEIYTEDNKGDEEDYYESYKYEGRYNAGLDMSFIYFLEPYLTLAKETKNVNGVECFVLTIDEAFAEDLDVKGSEFLVTSDTYHLISVVIESRLLDSFQLSYENANIELPEYFNYNLEIENEEYPQEYNGNFFYQSTIEVTGLDAFNINVNDLDIKIGEKADFANFVGIESDDYKVVVDKFLFIDGFTFNDDYQPSGELIDPGVYVQYDVDYETDSDSERTTVITKNMSDSPVAQSECVVVGMIPTSLLGSVETDALDLNICDLKKIFGNDYNTMCLKEEDDVVAITWEIDDYFVLSLYDEYVDGVMVLNSDLFNILKTFLFEGDAEESESELIPSTKKSASEFTVDGKKYKLYDAVVGDFKSIQIDEEPIDMFKSSKMYMHMNESLTAPIAIAAVGSHLDAQVVGYTVCAIDDININFKMSNGLSLNNSYDDFVYVLGEPDKISREDDVLTAIWQADDGIYNINVEFDVDGDKTGDVLTIAVFDFKAYTVDFILGLAETIFNDSMNELFGRIEENFAAE